MFSKQEKSILRSKGYKIIHDNQDNKIKSALVYDRPDISTRSSILEASRSGLPYALGKTVDEADGKLQKILVQEGKL